MSNLKLTDARVRRKTREVKESANTWGLSYWILSIIIVGSILIPIASNKFESWVSLMWAIAITFIVGAGGYVAVRRLISYAGASLGQVERMSTTTKSALNEGKFKALIQHSLDIITIVDSNGSIQYLSPSTERVLGYNPDSLVGQSIYELVHSDDHALMRNATGQKTTFFFSFRMQHHDGSWLYFESSGTNMLQDPLIRGIVLNSRDITDRKREEEAKKQKELAAMTFNLQREQAEKEKRIIEESKKQLEEAYSIIEHKNNEIHDSITYAFRIQKAMLPEIEVIKQYLPESFIFWRPKDIVSGDFYWFAQMGDYTLISAADCTGHGVPGAFMTMIGNTLLNQVVKQQGNVMPDQILNNLHLAVRRALRQDEKGSTSRDGMDISFLCLDSKNKKVYWAGANNPLIIVRNGEHIEYKADKYSIGGLQTEDQRIFTLLEMDMQAGDTYYVYSDGFQDQFGGDKGRKYMTKRFKEYLAQISTKAPEEQAQVLDIEFSNWLGSNFEQIDDVLVVGVKV